MWNICFIQMNHWELIFVWLSYIVFFVFFLDFCSVLAGTSEEDDFTGKAQTFTYKNRYYIWIELLGLTFAVL